MSAIRFRSRSAALVAAAVASYAGCIDPGGTHDWPHADAAFEEPVGAAGSPAGEPTIATDGHELVAEALPANETVRMRASVVDPSLVPPEVLAELNASLVPKAIVGKDTRSPVAKTKIAPYKAVVRLFTRFVKGGGTWGCTGIMIASDAVLTAAHCVYDSIEAPVTGYAYSVSVVPGLYPKSPRPTSGVVYNAPFGVGYGKKLHVAPRYPANEADAWNRIAHDYAVIRLQAPIARAGARSYAARNDLLEQPVAMLGYHGDLSQALRMHESKDRVRKVLANGTFNHYLDEAKQSSGSGIALQGTNTIVGIHSSSIDGTNPYNIASTLTAEKVRYIAGWLKGGAL
jgi:V8-like Glu-specific endopeptidase